MGMCIQSITIMNYNEKSKFERLTINTKFIKIKILIYQVANDLSLSLSPMENFNYLIHKP